LEDRNYRLKIAVRNEIGQFNQALAAFAKNGE
jgi:hypothetical protein